MIIGSPIITSLSSGQDITVDSSLSLSSENPVQNKVISGTLADEYTRKTYAVGDVCIHNGVLYSCKTAITEAEDWTAEHWEESNIGDAVSNLSRQLSDETTGLNSKAPVILETASGAIASFDDGADDMPVKKLVAQIEPVQDLHGYDHPWPAGGGDNIMPPVNQWPTGDTLIKEFPTEISLQGIALSFRFSGSYTYGGAAFLALKDANGNNSATFTMNGMRKVSDNTYLTPNTVYTNERVYSVGNISTTYNVKTIYTYSNATFNNPVFDELMIEAGTTINSFKPYSNICPISGHTGAEIEQTGKNLFDGQVVSGDYDITHLLKVGNTYTITADFINSSDTAYYYLFKGNADHTDSIRIAYILAGHNRFTPSFVVEEDKYYWVWGGAGWNNVKNVQLELGSTATAYELYTGNQISVDWEDEAGTIHGGTVTLNPDRTGTLTVTAVLEQFKTVVGDILSSDLSIDSFNKLTGDTTVIGNVTRIVFAKDSSTAYNRISSDYAYKMCNMAKHYFSYNDPSVHWYRNTVLYVFLPTELVGSTSQSVFDYLVSIKDTNPLSLWIPLITPITYTLTAEQVSGILTTLYGTNNIWSSTGDVEVEYPADTRLYIEKLTQPTEDDMTADHAIASGTFFMIGNTLYLATAQIAAGATITPGTNATKLSLADALNTLNT